MYSDYTVIYVRQESGILININRKKNSEGGSFLWFTIHGYLSSVLHNDLINGTRAKATAVRKRTTAIIRCPARRSYSLPEANEPIKYPKLLAKKTKLNSPKADEV